jgi:hypothetical protein
MISCMLVLDRSGAQVSHSDSGFSRVEHLFVSGANPQVNVVEDDSAGPCDRGHGNEKFVQKELAFAGNRPKLRISPRPGSGSSGLYGLRKSFHSSSLQPASSFQAIFPDALVVLGFKGHGFSRAVRAARSAWALAPEGCFPESRMRLARLVQPVWPRSEEISPSSHSLGGTAEAVPFQSRNPNSHHRAAAAQGQLPAALVINPAKSSFNWCNASTLR